MKYLYNGTRPLWPYSFNLYVSDVNFFRFNWHSDFEFILLLSGCISLRTRSDIFTLNEGDVFLLNSNCGHTWLSERTDAAALIMHFSPEYFSCLEPSFKKLEIQCVSTPQSRNEPRFTRLRCLAAQMMLAASSQEPAARFILRGAFTMLLGYLLSEFPFTNSNELESPHDHKNLKTIQTVLDWLERNYDRKITLEEAAKVARYNRTYFSSFFRRNVGIPFYDYLTRVRFRHALYLLNSTGKSLTDIAADCGFPDLKTFSTYYKKTFHEPPSVQHRAIDSHAFTPGRERENLYLDTTTPGIDDKLHAFANFYHPKPTSLPLPLAPADLARIADLCGQILKIAECGSKTR